ncbi:MAG: DUF1385 domain-containing protein [Anaerolineae bacterium]|nr:DUF1385 domain-containing protein [Anaerolineae bacterium]
MSIWRKERSKPLAYGGQAVIEGVMMRGANRVAVAVRKPNGEIVVHEETLNPTLYRGPISRMPFVRGLLMLWDALGIGMRALMWSAQVAMGQENPTFESPAELGLVSMGMSTALFMATPAVASGWLGRWLGLKHNALTNMLEGMLRLGLVAGYITLIGQTNEGERLFAYHGAEHKTINAYEAGAPLTPESVKRFPLEHPRCGTAFLLTVMVISTLFHALIGRPRFPMLLITRLLMLPLIAGVAYEFIRFASNNMDNPTVRTIVAPNLFFQRLTTREPSLEMLEVAIRAFERVQTGVQDMEAADYPTSETQSRQRR